jgi:hypothetical protein
MSDKMPEGLRKHFEAQEKGSQEGKEGGDKSKMARKEALRKAKKAKMKRAAEKEGAKG